MMGAAALWNKGAVARSPPRWCSAGRRRRAIGVVSSRILGSGEVWCSKGGRCGGGDGGLVELLSPAPVFVSVWLLLASPWGCWGCCGGVLVLGAGSLLSLYRSFSAGISELSSAFGAVLEPLWSTMVVWAGAALRLRSVFFFDWFLLSLAGRGGEGRWWDLGVLWTTTPASCVRALRREGGRWVDAGWRHGRVRSALLGAVACGGRLLRLSTCVGCFFPEVGGARRLLLRRRSVAVLVFWYVWWFSGGLCLLLLCFALRLVILRFLVLSSCNLS